MAPGQVARASVDHRVDTRPFDMCVILTDTLITLLWVYFVKHTPRGIMPRPACVRCLSPSNRMSMALLVAATKLQAIQRGRSSRRSLRDAGCGFRASLQAKLDSSKASEPKASAVTFDVAQSKLLPAVPTNTLFCEHARMTCPRHDIHAIHLVIRYRVAWIVAHIQHKAPRGPVLALLKHLRKPRHWTTSKPERLALKAVTTHRGGHEVVVIM